MRWKRFLSRLFNASGYVLIVLSLALTIYIREQSPTFQKCLSEQETKGSEQQKKEDSSVFFSRVVAFKCTGDFLQKNEVMITAVATMLIAFFTFTLWGAAKAQRVHERDISRAYISGGGSMQQGGENFVLSINNYGQTPATLTGFAVEFCDANRVPDTPAYDVPGYVRHPWDALYPPGTEGRPIQLVPYVPNTTCVYGRFWYRDIWGDEHSSGFILEIRGGGTGPFLHPVSRRYNDFD
jgi:hypothetical protein